MTPRLSRPSATCGRSATPRDGLGAQAALPYPRCPRRTPDLVLARPQLADRRRWTPLPLRLGYRVHARGGDADVCDAKRDQLSSVLASGNDGANGRYTGCVGGYRAKSRDRFQIHTLTSFVLGIIFVGLALSGFLCVVSHEGSTAMDLRSRTT